MVSEQREEAYFRKAVREAGGWTLKFAPLLKGTPDRVVLMPGGRIYFVELKTTEGDLSAIQLLWHRRAHRLGTNVVVLHGRKEIQQWIRSVSGQA